jgi:thiol-disulfide isomerase/thioredoxin
LRPAEFTSIVCGIHKLLLRGCGFYFEPAIKPINGLTTYTTSCANRTHAEGVDSPVKGYNPAAMPDASYLADRFAVGLPYDRYVQTGSEEQQRRWSQVYDAARLSGAQRQLITGFVREMKILIFSGIWCGDCVQQCPLIRRIAEINPAKIDLRFIERPKETGLAPEMRINAGSRVPLVIFLSEDDEWCATAGDRTINRYRALAHARLGVFCPTGIVAPDKDELNATLVDWLDEVERVQLMLRLTPRLRQKYRD